MNWIYNMLDSIKTFIENNLWIAPFFSILLPFIEAIVPSLPLTAIISLNISVMAIAFGVIPGTIFAVLLSTVGSFLGMFIIFLIIRKTLSKRFVRKVEESEHGKWFIDIVAKGNTGLMLLILSNPLLPSSILNYAISLTNIKVRKYIFLTFMSRIIIVLFLVFLGSIFDIQDKPLNILWVMLVYSGIIFAYGLFIKYRNKRNDLKEESRK